MKIRTNWLKDSSKNIGSLNPDEYMSKEEIINEVKTNFDFRRFYSAEGETLIINNVEVQCLVQTSSNPLHEFKDLREIHVPYDFNLYLGDYVSYKDKNWIVNTNIVDVSEAYKTTQMRFCNLTLKWANSANSIISRPCYTDTYTSDGEKPSTYITDVESKQVLYLPYDAETVLLKREKRIMLGDTTYSTSLIENNIPVKVYEISDVNIINMTFQGHGIVKVTCKEVAANPTLDDKTTLLSNYKVEPTAVLSNVIIASNSEFEYREQFDGKLRVGLGYDNYFRLAQGIDQLKFTAQWSIISTTGVGNYFTIEGYDSVDAVKLTCTSIPRELYGTQCILRVVYNKSVYELLLTLASSLGQ